MYSLAHIRNAHTIAPVTMLVCMNIVECSNVCACMCCYFELSCCRECSQSFLLRSLVSFALVGSFSSIEKVQLTIEAAKSHQYEFGWCVLFDFTTLVMISSLELAYESFRFFLLHLVLFSLLYRSLLCMCS